MNSDAIARAKENALARFADTGPGRINCSQAVLSFALEALQQDPNLTTVAAYFGGGIGGMGEACGAITGAAMALGARDYFAAGPDAERAARSKAGLQDAVRGFAEEFGACRCIDLTGYDVSTPEGFQAFKQSEAKDRCPVYVGWMIDQIAPLLEV